MRFNRSTPWVGMLWARLHVPVVSIRLKGVNRAAGGSVWSAHGVEGRGLRGIDGAG